MRAPSQQITISSLFGVTILVVAVLYRYLNPPLTELTIINEIWNRSPIRIEAICGRQSSSCIIVQDVVSNYNGIFLIRRYMKVRGSPDFASTIVQLIQPKVLTEYITDTTKLAVNKSIVVSLYNQILLSAGFFTKALSIESDTSQNVLIIGLGGAAVANFLAQIPKAKITYVWSEEVRRGNHVKWDSTTPREWRRRITTNLRKIKNSFFEGFLEHETIQNMADILDDNGSYMFKTQGLVVDSEEERNI